MVSFRPKRRKVFRVRAQAFAGKRTRIGLVSPGIRRAKRRRGEKITPTTTARPTPVL
ncbi:hypothetical protein SEA_Phreeze_6 [Mycobacterium phage Phreeze]|uniref:Uncharacterized protein n=1 Tax=Mycobacterium phage Konstantine TaxID=563121 RepID=B5U4X8_9CAUD|nr:gp8 [Mycobacterium phage Konstantine]ACI12424.1 hypothetical protein KONSTANTINE_8 [Mycobacterium phage Konstantine]AXH47217.1 hypothetical protein SEA_CBORCH11_6 [Mycobacterium phage Cborch11]QDH84870.1 hypothetical protein SEA_Phreeze_6 [Mycobacterium phage Phreeze]